jgi:streptogramin lyase
MSGLNHMTGVTLDGNGGLLIAAYHNSRVKRLDLDSGIVEFLCGTGFRAFSGDGGPAEEADMDLPVAIVVDSLGRVIIADQANNRIRRVDASDIITTVAGTGKGTGTDPVTMMPNPECIGASLQGSADCFIDGDLLTATLNNPRGQSAEPSGRIAIDANDIIYVADTANNAIRRIDLAGDEMITIAGLGPTEAGYSGDGGPASEARLNKPSDIEVTADGTLYIADTENHCIRTITPDGTISTVAGVCGESGPLKEGKNRLEALFNRPFALTVGPDGNLYVSDTGNNAIRVVYLSAPAE